MCKAMARHCDRLLWRPARRPPSGRRLSLKRQLSHLRLILRYFAIQFKKMTSAVSKELPQNSVAPSGANTAGGAARLVEALEETFKGLETKLTETGASLKNVQASYDEQTLELVAAKESTDNLLVVDKLEAELRSIHETHNQTLSSTSANTAAALESARAIAEESSARKVAALQQDIEAAAVISRDIQSDLDVTRKALKAAKAHEVELEKTVTSLSGGSESATARAAELVAEAARIEVLHQEEVKKLALRLKWCVTRQQWPSPSWRRQQKSPEERRLPRPRQQLRCGPQKNYLLLLKKQTAASLQKQWPPRHARLSLKAQSLH